jgi:predicted SprT family Zn-dependent metalloprotease
MDLPAAEAMARELMERHGVFAAGWRFAWSNGKRQLGAACVHADGRKTLRLSRHLVRLNDDAEVRDTILHEIAHAIAGVEHGHDAVWKSVCVRIGARPVRVAGEEVNVVEGRYVLVCGACCRVLARRHRRVRPARLKRAYCRGCGPTAAGRLRLLDARSLPAPGLFEQVSSTPRRSRQRAIQPIS